MPTVRALPSMDERREVFGQRAEGGEAVTTNADADLVELVVSLAASGMYELLDRLILAELNRNHGQTWEQGCALLSKIDKAIARARRRLSAKGNLRPSPLVRRRVIVRC
jgi:hypothetical protein